MHAGASTQDIIIQFINLVRALYVVDPTGISSNRINSVIAPYLRKRKDAVRCVMTELINPDGELFEELRDSGKDSVAALDGCSNEDVDEEDDMSENWNPVPMTGFHYLPFKTQENQTMHSFSEQEKPDIIKMLINVFPSKQMLVNYYQSVLAGEILTDTARHAQYDTTKQALLQELLKIRFGESSMHRCEVMIKDMSDSRRINRSFHKNQTSSEQHISVENNTNVIDTLVISRHFWPDIVMELVDEEEEKLSGVKLHPDIVAFMKQYESHFKTLKAPRYLVWLHSLCRLELDVELDDGHTISFRHLTPVLASVLLYLVESYEQNKSSWRLREISERIGLDEEATSSALRYFLSQPKSRRILRRSTMQKNGETIVVFHMLSGAQEQEVLNDNDGSHDMPSTPGDVNEKVDMMSTTDTAASVSLTSFAEHEPIVIGILKNFSDKPLDELHSMLDMFDISMPVSELSLLMKHLVQEGKVRFDGSVYSA